MFDLFNRFNRFSCKRCGSPVARWGIIRTERATYDECAECGHHNIRRTFPSRKDFAKEEALKQFEPPHQLRVRDSGLESGGTTLVSLPIERVATQTHPSQSDVEPR